jgi:hypothetical protein
VRTHTAVIARSASDEAIQLSLLFRIAMTCLPETKMTKGAFEKIKAGIDDVRRYLDGSADKREFRVRELADSKIDSTSVEAQARPPEKAT